MRHDNKQVELNLTRLYDIRDKLKRNDLEGLKEAPLRSKAKRDG